ncbi:hypothetical protein TCAL_07749 [Tigriopus californicus]|uniref:Piwi domain-containing protein n=1 Tax=Tigriopus californicus TaxID=6832 RepID=A0A553PRV3_TIGCA|nr:hypothetical protein TCAL_07749 [Tigriopus californicus]
MTWSFLNRNKKMSDPAKRNMGRGALLLERIKRAQQEKENSSGPSRIANPAPDRIPAGFITPQKENKEKLQRKLRDLRSIMGIEPSARAEYLRESKPIQTVTAPSQSDLVPIFDSSDSAVSSGSLTESTSSSRSPTQIPSHELDPTSDFKSGTDTSTNTNNSPVRFVTENQLAALPNCYEGTNHSASKSSVGSSSHTSNPPTQNRGDAGTKVRLEVNYLNLKVVDGKGFFEYEVQFDPEVDSRQHRFALLRQLTDHIGRAKNFDGGFYLCLPKRLEHKISVFHPVLPESNDPVQVTLVFKKAVDYTHSRALFWYNVLFKRVFHALKMVQMNQRSFNPRNPTELRDLKLEIWPGYATAVDEYDGGLKLVCDTVHRVLRTDTVHDLIKEIHFRNMKSRPNFCHAVKQAIMGQVVLTRYNNRTYRIDDVDFYASPESEFETSRGKTTYLEYYKRQYGIDIADTKQALLISKPKKTDEWNKDMVICLVPELCHLTGLDENLRKDHRAMRTVVNIIGSTPAKRHKALQMFVSSVKSSAEASQILSDWGLELADAALSVDGRCMKGVGLLFGNSSVRKGICGDFDRALQGEQMMSGAKLKNWLIIGDRRDTREIEGFISTWHKQCDKLGMTIYDPRTILLNQDRTDEVVKVIHREHQNHPLEMVLVVARTKRADRYGAVKKTCLVELGIPSQFVLTKSISNGRNQIQVVQKLAIQVNAKLGGANWGISSPFSNAMVIGIDVYHNADGGKSWSGFVASLNRTFTCWFSDSRQHQYENEIMNNISDIFGRALKAYYELNNQYPDKIVVYRDGVGDSRFEVTETLEIEQMRSTLKRIAPEKKVQITFVIVSKRIKTRMFLIQGDTHDNPPPGTVLDHTVTRRQQFNFYLVSQKVTQGTVSPTHYTVLLDELELGPDRVQRLTYMLTYLYYNFTGPVRVPAPCLYAHKVANLCGEFLKKQVHTSQKTNLFYL